MREVMGGASKLNFSGLKWGAAGMRALAVVLPTMAVYAVAETATGSNNNRSNTNKPAVLENGEGIRVPLFIETGDRVVVRTDDGTYVSKADKGDV